MDIFQAIILGVVEGVTEFLPISSTAHLIIASKLLNIPQTDFVKFFEVFIQSGAILAVVFLYFSYVMKHKEILPKVLYSFIPTAVIGFFLYKTIKSIFFDSLALMSGALIFFGIVFLIIEILIQKKKLKLQKPLSAISWKEAVLVGLNQSIAVVPGVSRAGIVMITMMGLGFKRDESAVYSFLLAVPTIVVASLYDLYKMKNLVLGSLQYLPIILVGFAVSFVTAYVSVTWLIKYLQRSSLVPFGIYRNILGVLIWVI